MRKENPKRSSSLLQALSVLGKLVLERPTQCCEVQVPVVRLPFEENCTYSGTEVDPNKKEGASRWEEDHMAYCCVSLNISTHTYIYHYIHTHHCVHRHIYRSASARDSREKCR